MTKHTKRALIAVILSFVAPVWIYLIFTNLFWPDLAWGIRQWHQILGAGMIIATVAAIVTYCASRDSSDL